MGIWLPFIVFVFTLRLFHFHIVFPPSFLVPLIVLWTIACMSKLLWIQICIWICWCLSFDTWNCWPHTPTKSLVGQVVSQFNLTLVTSELAESFFSFPWGNLNMKSYVKQCSHTFFPLMYPQIQKGTDLSQLRWSPHQQCFPLKKYNTLV